MDALNDEVLFVGTAEAEHVEMYFNFNQRKRRRSQN